MDSYTWGIAIAVVALFIFAFRAHEKSTERSKQEWQMHHDRIRLEEEESLAAADAYMLGDAVSQKDVEWAERRERKKAIKKAVKKELRNREQKD